jgi:L-iditol 2-dehydrogenase
MKAVVKYKAGKGNVDLLDMPEPICGDDQVIIQIDHCGICGTDLHVYHDNFRNYPPVILGHEFVGAVVEQGKNVTGHYKNQKFSVFGAIAKICGHCVYCYRGEHFFCKERRGMGHGVHGAFTNYAAVRPDQLYSVPSNISVREAALVEPLAAAVHAVTEVAKFKLGDTVLVSGPGPIGLLIVKLLARMGIKTIVAGTSDDIIRLRLATSYGAHKTIMVDNQELSTFVRAETNGRGVDAAFEAAGVQASVRSCLEQLKPMGHYIQVGHFGKDLLLPWDLVAFKQLKIDGSVGYNRSTWNSTMQILEQGLHIQDLITHEMPISDWEQGFNLMESKKAVKILLHP